MISIRRSIPSDLVALWEIFHQVVKSGDTYVFHPDTNKGEFKKIWFGENIATYTCYDDQLPTLSGGHPLGVTSSIIHHPS